MKVSGVGLDENNKSPFFAITPGNQSLGGTSKWVIIGAQDVTTI